MEEEFEVDSSGHPEPSLIAVVKVSASLVPRRSGRGGGEENCVHVNSREGILLPPVPRTPGYEARSLVIRGSLSPAASGE